MLSLTLASHKHHTANMQMAEGVVDPMEHQDIAMLSPHKFAGGPGSAGVLVIKRDALRTKQPQIPGALCLSARACPRLHALALRTAQRGVLS